MGLALQSRAAWVLSLALAASAGIGDVAVVASAQAPAEDRRPPPRDRDSPEGDDDVSDIEGRDPRVTSRADVEIRLDSGAGVDSDRLLDWSEGVGRRSEGLRLCYAARLDEQPTLEGEMRVEMVLTPRRRRPRLRVIRDETDDQALSRCVLRALRRVRLRDLDHPETVFVQLTFRHSIARATRAFEERAARARAAFEAGLEVGRTPDGGYRAAGASGNRLVHYRGEAATEAGAKRLAGLAHARLPALFDCRRRAGRRGASPEGEVTVAVRLDVQGRVRADAQEVTVEGPGAGRCIVDALTARADDGDGAMTGRLVVGFREREDSTPSQRAPSTTLKPASDR